MVAVVVCALCLFVCLGACGETKATKNTSINKEGQGNRDGWLHHDSNWHKDDERNFTVLSTLSSLGGGIKMSVERDFCLCVNKVSQMNKGPSWMDTIVKKHHMFDIILPCASDTSSRRIAFALQDYSPACHTTSPCLRHTGQRPRRLAQPAQLGN